MRIEYKFREEFYLLLGLYFLVPYGVGDIWFCLVTLVSEEIGYVIIMPGWLNLVKVYIVLLSLSINLLMVLRC